ncbi:unnamed protein product, partial [Polarella glacialis]
ECLSLAPHVLQAFGPGPANELSLKYADISALQAIALLQSWLQGVGDSSQPGVSWDDAVCAGQRALDLLSLVLGQCIEDHHRGQRLCCLLSHAMARAPMLELMD